MSKVKTSISIIETIIGRKIQEVVQIESSLNTLRKVSKKKYKQEIKHILKTSSDEMTIEFVVNEIGKITHIKIYPNDKLGKNINVADFFPEIKTGLDVRSKPK